MVASGPAADALAAGAVRRPNRLVVWSIGLAGYAAAVLVAARFASLFWALSEMPCAS